MAPPTAAASTPSSGQRSLRDRIAVIVRSEAIVWALVLGLLSAVAAASGALAD